MAWGDSESPLVQIGTTVFGGVVWAECNTTSLAKRKAAVGHTLALRKASTGSQISWILTEAEFFHSSLAIAGSGV